MDRRFQLVAVGSALVLDLMVLGAMVARIGDLGFTPNRVGRARSEPPAAREPGRRRLAVRAVPARHGSFHRLERWQTSYLPVFALWAAAVVILLPPLFGFD